MSQDAPQTRQLINPPDIAPPAETYSHIYSIPLPGGAKMITIAGQVGFDPVTRKTPQTLSAQVEVALSNLGKCLIAVGAGVKDIVQVTQYVVNLHPIDPARKELYLKFFDGHKPPSTLIGVASLAELGLLYEIQVLVVVDGSKTVT